MWHTVHYKKKRFVVFSAFCSISNYHMRQWIQKAHFVASRRFVSMLMLSEFSSRSIEAGSLLQCSISPFFVLLSNPRRKQTNSQTAPSLLYRLLAVKFPQLNSPIHSVVFRDKQYNVQSRMCKSQNENANCLRCRFWKNLYHAQNYPNGRAKSKT